MTTKLTPTLLAPGAANTNLGFIPYDSTNPAGYITSSGTAAAAGTLTTSNWTISESGGKLYFAYGGVNKFSFDSAGNFIAVNNVTGAGTP